MTNLILIIIGLIVTAALIVGLLVLRSLKKPKEDNQMGIIHQRLDSFTKQMFDVLEKNRQSNVESSSVVHTQVKNFSVGLTQLQEQIKGMYEYNKESLKNVESLQNVFRSPKLRGQWGEMSLEFALRTYFPEGSYKMQYFFGNGEAVDAAIHLPNGFILPIDAKFNLDNFEKLASSEDEAEREQYRKMFLLDVRKQIDDIAAKYIRPSEGTVDLAIMYIPAEAIFYEVVYNSREASLHDYALKKRIHLASPNTFGVMLTAVRHWYQNVHIHEKTKEIVKGLEVVKKDSALLEDEFRKLGGHLSNTQSAFERSNKRLGLMTKRMGSVIKVGNTKEEIKEAAEDPIAVDSVVDSE